MNMEAVFDRFVTALENNDMDAMNSLLTEDIFVDSSALGTFQGLDTFKTRFAWQGRPVDFVKIRIFNNVMRCCGEDGSQNVFFVIMAGTMENGFMNLFQCAFLNVFRYRKEENGWKICELRSNMTFECGNTMLVSNWWKLIDYRLIDGCERKIIHPSMSAWERIPQTDLPVTEEEKVRQTVFAYCWRIDTGAFDRLHEVATAGMHFEMPGMDPAAAGGYKEWVQFLVGKRYDKVTHNGETMCRNVCWNHIFLVDKVEINGDHAKAHVLRLEPNRIGNYMQHRYNLNTLYLSTPMELNMCRDEAGVWKLFKTVVAGDRMLLREDLSNQRYF